MSDNPPRTLSNQTLVVISKDQVSCDLAGEAAILDLKSGVYYGLDAVGARIWDFLKEPRTFSQIVAMVLEEYDVEAPQCDQDTRELLQQLADAGLVGFQDPAESENPLN